MASIDTAPSLVPRSQKPSKIGVSCKFLRRARFCYYCKHLQAAAKYSTSRVASPPGKVKRQTTYSEAVQTLPDTSLYFGRYQLNTQTRRNCGYVRNAPSEKTTDVNIAVELLQDVFQDAFDTAILISADSDLLAPITAAKSYFPAKRVVVACPPSRYSQSPGAAASAYLKIGPGAIAKSQIPDQVPTATGFTLNRPSTWL